MVRIKLTGRFAAILVVLLLSSVTGCSNNSPASSPNGPLSPQVFQVPNTYTTYTDGNGLFSVSYPKQWQTDSSLTDPGQNTGLAAAVSKLKAGSPLDADILLFTAGPRTTTDIPITLTIDVSPIPKGITDIEQAPAAFIATASGQGYQEISRTKTVVSGKDALIIESRFNRPGSVYHASTLMVLSGNNIWMVNCGAPDGLFSQWSNDFNNIVRSFKLTG